MSVWICFFFPVRHLYFSDPVLSWRNTFRLAQNLQCRQNFEAFAHRPHPFQHEAFQMFCRVACEGPVFVSGTGNYFQQGSELWGSISKVNLWECETIPSHPTANREFATHCVLFGSICNVLLQCVCLWGTSSECSQNSWNKTIYTQNRDLFCESANRRNRYQSWQNSRDFSWCKWVASGSLTTTYCSWDFDALSAQKEIKKNNHLSHFIRHLVPRWSYFCQSTWQTIIVLYEPKFHFINTKGFFSEPGTQNSPPADWKFLGEITFFFSTDFTRCKIYLNWYTTVSQG